MYAGVVCCCFGIECAILLNNGNTPVSARLIIVCAFGRGDGERPRMARKARVAESDQLARIACCFSPVSIIFSDRGRSNAYELLCHGMRRF